MLSKFHSMNEFSLACGPTFLVFINQFCSRLDMMIIKILLTFLSWPKLAVICQEDVTYHVTPIGTNYNYFSNFSAPTSALRHPNSQEMMGMMDENGPPDYKSEIAIKLLLSVVVIKSITFTLLLLILALVIPSLNPSYQKRRK